MIILNAVKTSNLIQERKSEDVLVSAVVIFLKCVVIAAIVSVELRPLTGPLSIPQMIHE
jgi:hypothetical protein